MRSMLPHDGRNRLRVRGLDRRLSHSAQRKTAVLGKPLCKEGSMLTTYFKHPFTLNKLRSGPAGPYLDEFACQLIRDGYSYSTGRRHLRGAGRLSSWAQRRSLTTRELDAFALKRFGRHLASRGKLYSARCECSCDSSVPTIIVLRIWSMPFRRWRDGVGLVCQAIFARRSWSA